MRDDLGERWDPLGNGDYHLPGLEWAQREIDRAYKKPGGKNTGRLLPTHNPQDWIFVRPRNKTIEPFRVQISVVDAESLIIIIDIESLPESVRQASDIGTPEMIQLVEDIRRVVIKYLGLKETFEQLHGTRGLPKVAFIDSAKEHLTNGKLPLPDIFAIVFNEGRIQAILRAADAVCLATAVCIERTVAYRIAHDKTRHPIYRLGQRPKACKLKRTFASIYAMSNIKLVCIEDNDDERGGLRWVRIELCREYNDELSVEMGAVIGPPATWSKASSGFHNLGLACSTSVGLHRQVCLSTRDRAS